MSGISLKQYKKDFEQLSIEQDQIKHLIDTERACYNQFSLSLQNQTENILNCLNDSHFNQIKNHKSELTRCCEKHKQNKNSLKKILPEYELLKKENEKICDEVPSSLHELSSDNLFLFKESHLTKSKNVIAESIRILNYLNSKKDYITLKGRS